ncbi:MAG: YfhO family protein [Flavobacteriaceae bacterium]|nr:YfhO family protein [Flavobacteriaceae bacterium]
MKNLIDSFIKTKAYIHLIVISGFALISLAFYYPVLSGKILLQSDIRQYNGMARQLMEYREKTGKETFWIDNAYGGMPTYQLGAKYPGDFLSPIYDFFRLLPRPAHILFLYFFGAYLLLLILKIPWHTALFGAFAFGFSTYLLIILQVGHNTKALAVSFFPFVIGGLVLLFRRYYFWGFLLSSLAFGMQIRANHYQMTYYLLFLVGIFAFVWGVQAFKQKQISDYLRSMVLLIVSGILALGFNATPLLATAEYAKFSTRGASELNFRANGSPKEQSSGLDYNYITEYSYGIFESLNLIIPRIQGGGSSENLGEKHGVYEFLLNNGVRPSQAKEFSTNVPTYWGSQPILEAPAYIGITVFFFALLALIYVRSPLRNTLVIGILFSLLLSWGKNFSLLTDFFIDFVPFYNKFRAVSSIQIVLEFCFPVLAVLGLQWALTKQTDFNLTKNAKFLGILILLFFALLLFKGSLSFSGVNDAYFIEIYGIELVNIIKQARVSIFQEDIIRSLLITIVLASLVLYYQIKNTNRNLILGLIIGVLLFDLIGISSRYITRDTFVKPALAATPFQITAADQAILQDSSRYRVFEPQLGLTGARTAYFHNSLGGYHGAKPRRFEELFDYYKTHQIPGVLDILNVKYVLVTDQKKNTLQPLNNPNVLGNAWTVEKIKVTPSADALLKELKKTDFSSEALVIDRTFPKDLAMKYAKDSLTTIELTKTSPDELIYKIQSQSQQFVVFSEMYYPFGWTARVNNKDCPIVNVNYLLRGLEIPAGKSTVVFSFKPQIVTLGSQIRWCSLILFMLFSGGIYYIKPRSQIQSS